jgi:hypothetical protein
MLKTRGALLGCAAAATWLATSCTDATSPTAMAPVRVEAQRDALLGGVINSVTSLLIAPVQRKQPLPSDVSWSFDAGPLGATTSNAAVGVTVVIPAGALSTTQHITVTALAGSAVAYGFSPHLEFAKSVRITQDLRVTNLDGLLLLPVLSGAHFSGDVPSLTSDGLAIVDELVSALANPLNKTATFNVSHFSGWIVASGKSSGGN